MQTHQQSNFYHAPPVNLNPGTSSNTPYAPDRSYATIFNMPPVKSQGRNQDTMTGMSYERNSDQQHQILLSNPTNTCSIWPSLGAGAMQLNYLQKQARESTSVVTKRRFSSGFHSPSPYPLQSGVPSSLGGQCRPNYL